MTTRSKIIAAALVALALVSALGGGWVTNWWTHRHGAWSVTAPTTAELAGRFPDPQQYMRTVHTPRESGTDAYVAWFEQRCRKEAFVAIYTLNNPRVVDQWIANKNTYGTRITVLLDLTESRAVESEKVQIQRLEAAGIEYHIGHSPEGSAIMHNKYTACDGNWVEDGSWNYTTSADDQGNTLNFNIVPSPMRYNLFVGDWTYLHDDFLQQEHRRNNRKH